LSFLVFFLYYKHIFDFTFSSFGLWVSNIILSHTLLFIAVTDVLSRLKSSWFVHAPKEVEPAQRLFGERRHWTLLS